MELWTEIIRILSDFLLFFMFGLITGYILGDIRSKS